MRKPQKSIRIQYLWLLIFATCVGCRTSSQLVPSIPAPAIAPTSTPEQIQIVSGEPDACALFTATEIQSILGVKTTAEAILYENATACRYVTTTSEPQEVLLTLIYTDETLQKAGKSYSASSWFEKEKEFNLQYVAQIGEEEIQDVTDLGDQAYYKVGPLIDLYILKNNIEYVLETISPESEESGSVDKLLSLAKLAINRMP